MNGATDIETFFQLFPEPNMARDLFNILEDFRIESRIKDEYPVLGEQVIEVNLFLLNRRPDLDDMAGDKQRIVEIIGQWLTTGKTKQDVPPRLLSLFEFAQALAGKLETPRSSIHDAAAVASEMYFSIDDAFPKDAYRPVLPFSAFIDPMKTDSYDARLGGKDGSKSRSEAEPEDKDASRPPANAAPMEDRTPPVSHRSDTATEDHREPVFRPSDLPEFEAENPAEDAEEPKKRSKRLLFGEDGMQPDDMDAADPFPSEAPSRPAVPELRSSSATGEELEAAPISCLYPEWGVDIEGYRVNWARVTERRLSGGSEDFYRSTLTKYAGLVKKIKREFQMLRPEGVIKFKRQVDGNEIDLDAAVEYFIDRKLGITPSEKNYIRTRKSSRDIAVAFLLDMSGSTRGTAISLEKEALIILSEALHELGDTFSIYGFSGHTRENVEFFVIKDFLEPYDHRITRKISAIRDLHSTRIGPAIRHTHTKLGRREEKFKLLILLSDGKPEDSGYNDAYGIEDTRMALKEGLQQGIRPFCITIDAAAPEYLHRMYSHSNWVVIQKMEKLPLEITRVYKRLTT
ncbi:MAG: VWA domain-containing protein [Desulfobacterales bacterium]